MCILVPGGSGGSHVLRRDAGGDHGVAAQRRQQRMERKLDEPRASEETETSGAHEDDGEAVAGDVRVGGGGGMARATAS